MLKLLCSFPSALYNIFIVSQLIVLVLWRTISLFLFSLATVINLDFQQAAVFIEKKNPCILPAQHPIANGRRKQLADEYSSI